MKVISGGQTGADRAGLIAAHNVGLETGGYINKGFITELGSEPDLAFFGLKEIASIKYPTRTLANINASDFTWIFYVGGLDGGSALTEKYCQQLNKKYITYKLENFTDSNYFWEAVHSLAFEIAHYKPSILNIAGNRESKAPGIQIYLTRLLTEIFKKYDYNYPKTS